MSPVRLAPFYLKVNRQSDYSLMCIQQWVDVAVYLGREIYIISDNINLNKEIEKHIRYKGVKIMPGRINELLDYAKDIVEEKWVGAACAHLLPIFHSRSLGLDSYWAIDGDDTQFMLKTERIAEIISSLEMKSSDISMYSLDMWRSRSNNKHWTFGVVYGKNNFDLSIFDYRFSDEWMSVKNKGLNVTIDLFFTYLDKNSIVKLKTFFVNNIYFVHYGLNFVTKSGNCSLYHWAEGYLKFPFSSILFGDSDSRSKYKIVDCECIDILATVEECREYISRNVVNYGRTNNPCRTFAVEVEYAKRGDIAAINYLYSLDLEDIVAHSTSLIMDVAKVLSSDNCSPEQRLKSIDLYRHLYHTDPCSGLFLVKALWNQCNSNSDLEAVQICMQNLSNSDDFVYMLSHAYRDGRGVNKDLRKATELLLSIRNKTDVHIIELFDILWKINTPDSLKDAFDAIIAFSDSENPNILSRIGRAYFSGKGVCRDLNFASKYLSLAAKYDPSWGNYYCRVLSELGTEDSFEKLRCYIQNCTSEIDSEIIAPFLDLFNIDGVTYDKRVAELISNYAKEFDKSIVIYTNFAVNRGHIHGKVPKASIIFHSVSNHVVYFDSIVVYDDSSIVVSDKHFLLNVSGDCFSIPNDGVVLIGCRGKRVLCNILDYSSGLISECASVCRDFDVLNSLMRKYNPFCIGFSDLYLRNVHLLRSPDFKDYTIDSRMASDYLVRGCVDILPQMDIVLCSSNQLVDYIYVLIYSIRCNNYGHIDIWILQSDYSDVDKNSLKKYCDSIDLQLHFVDVDPSDFEILDVDKHWPRQIYYYLNSHVYLPDSVKRALYLDVDILVTSDLHTMYYSDFEDCLICACNLNTKRLYNGQDDLKNAMFYNGGVVLLNLEKFRSEGISLKTFRDAIDLHHANTQWGDQGLLNSVFLPKSKLLPSTYYNYSPMRYDRHLIDYFNYDSSLSEAYLYPFDSSKYPSIVHYTSGKPWSMPCVELKDGSFFSVTNQRYPFFSQYIQLWWMYVRHIPSDVRDRLYRAPRDVRAMTNFRELCEIISSKKSAIVNWTHEYCVKVLIRQRNFEYVQKILDNLDDCDYKDQICTLYRK